MATSRSFSPSSCSCAPDDRDHMSSSHRVDFSDSSSGGDTSTRSRARIAHVSSREGAAGTRWWCRQRFCTNASRRTCTRRCTAFQPCNARALAAGLEVIESRDRRLDDRLEHGRLETEPPMTAATAVSPVSCCPSLPTLDPGVTTSGHRHKAATRGASRSPRRRGSAAGSRLPDLGSCPKSPVSNGVVDRPHPSRAPSSRAGTTAVAPQRSRTPRPPTLGGWSRAARRIEARDH